MSFQEFTQRVIFVTFLVLILLSVWVLHDIFLIGFLAVLIAVGLSIPTRGLVSLGVRRGWAITFSVVVFLTTSITLTLIVVPSLLSDLNALIQSIPTAIRVGSNFYNDVRVQNEVLSSILPELESYATSELNQEIIPTIQEYLQRAVETAAPLILSGIGTLSAWVFNLFVIVVVFVFLLVDPKIYVTASLYLVPKSWHDRLISLYNELQETFTLWLKAQFTSILITMFLVWFVLGILLGMPNAITVAIFAGVATFIPNIGAVLPAIPIVVFGLADDPSSVWYLLLAYTIIQQIEGSILTPSIVKSRLQIPAGAVILFQIMTGTLFGFLGILLAIPLLAFLVTVVREVYSFGFLGLEQKGIHVAIAPSGELSIADPEVEVLSEIDGKTDPPAPTIDIATTQASAD